ncbi:hypothetical protein BKA62DRAFT_683012 [Auriculariales sp. MPI-PUGE-AT-0066]|nr:hypothetical protein BKA62DRAFT_683012 [Auriculariales sp. MPI-PUGE-AT-0066]
MLVVRAVVGPLTRGLTRAPPQARSIHLPPLTRVVGRSGLFGRFQTALHRALLSISQHVSHNAPRFPSTIRLAPRSTIGSSLSLPARFALARPINGTPFMPRPVFVRPPLHQVGLGTARTFATTRPIFANIVENVPVAARSLLEADFDLKGAPTQRIRALRANKENKFSRIKAKAKARVPKIARSAEPEKLDIETLAQYFKMAPTAAASVVTYLDIPLAPTPSGRMPLAAHPIPGPSALRALAGIQTTHGKHAIRVSSLFRRLDAANVWEKGAAMEPYGDGSGLCTVLRVIFSGWDEAKVKGVIGEGGKGWCTLLEVHQETHNPWASDTDDSHAAFSPRSLSPLPWAEEISGMDQVDVSAVHPSFIMPTMDMPTMDFSASFSRTSSAWSAVTSGAATPLTEQYDLDEPFSSYASSDSGHADVESLSSDEESLASVWETQ